MHTKELAVETYFTARSQYLYVCRAASVVQSARNLTSYLAWWFDLTVEFRHLR